MRYLAYTFIVLFSLATACKTDPAIAKQVAIPYPAIFAEKAVPTFTKGIIKSENLDESGPIKEHNVVFETEESFENIYNWHKQNFSNKGWKVVRDARKNIGQDTESILMVHTKGSTKHKITVLKSTIRTNEIKIILSYF